MSSITSLNLLLAFVAVASCVPYNNYEYAKYRRDGSLRYLQNDMQPECVEFSHHYCNRFNYSSAVFPNAMGQNFTEAAKQFADFDNLLSSDCSPYLGTLLCFMYFPFCNHATYPLVDAVYPCKEVCQNVTSEQSRCTELVRNSVVRDWADHLKCDYKQKMVSPNYLKDIYIPQDSIGNHFAHTRFCANGAAPEWVPRPTVVATTTEEPDKSTDKPMEGDKEDSSTEEPIQGPFDTDEYPLCPRCNFRYRATANVFKRNDYTFAARVKVNSSIELHGRRAFVVDRHTAYDLRSDIDGSGQLQSSPEIPSRFTIYTYGVECNVEPKCNQTLQDGVEYLVAGHYVRADSTIRWYLDVENSIIANWHTDLTTKMRNKIVKFINDGNDARQEKALSSS